MPTSTNVTNLKINKLTEAQYDAAVQQGIIGANEISILTDAGSGGFVPQYDPMPEASASNVGQLVQYKGADTNDYTNGYFYQCTQGQETRTATISQTAGSGNLTNLAVNVETFVAEEQPTQSGNTSFVYSGTEETLSPTVFTISQATITIDPSLFLPLAKQYAIDDGWDWSNLDHIRIIYGTPGQYPIDAEFLDENNNIIDTALELTLEAWGITIDGTLTEFDPLVMNYIQEGSVWTKNGTPVTLSDYGITYEGTPINDDALTVAYTEGAFTYSWEQRNVQPGDCLPTQTGNAGKVLKTDGINASWESTSTSLETPPTLVAANWSSNTQTITVQGVTATNTVIVSPIPTDAEDYAAAGILCTGQATNALTFTCQTTPASDLQVNIVIM